MLMGCQWLEADHLVVYMGDGVTKNGSLLAVTCWKEDPSCKCVPVDHTLHQDATAIWFYLPLFIASLRVVSLQLRSRSLCYFVFIVILLDST